MTYYAKPLGVVAVGDRVVLKEATLMDKAGAVGVVTRKYVPAHCTGVWNITVRWDGNTHETSYPYPNGIVHREKE